MEYLVDKSELIKSDHYPISIKLHLSTMVLGPKEITTQFKNYWITNYENRDKSKLRLYQEICSEWLANLKPEFREVCMALTDHKNG
jgi:hypothetical protein